jgi:hypothetical protein
MLKDEIKKKLIKKEYKKLLELTRDSSHESGIIS